MNEKLWKNQGAVLTKLLIVLLLIVLEYHTVHYMVDHYLGCDFVPGLEDYDNYRFQLRYEQFCRCTPINFYTFFFSFLSNVLLILIIKNYINLISDHLVKVLYLGIKFAESLIIYVT